MIQVREAAEAVGGVGGGSVIGRTFNEKIATTGRWSDTLKRAVEGTGGITHTLQIETSEINAWCSPPPKYSANSVSRPLSLLSRGGVRAHESSDSGAGDCRDLNLHCRGGEGRFKNSCKSVMQIRISSKSHLGFEFKYSHHLADLRQKDIYSRSFEWIG